MNVDVDRLTAEEAAWLANITKEIRLAEQAESFLAYCKSDELFGNEQPALHHERLIEALQRIEHGTIDRLMVYMPPGSAKSTYTSMRFASWYMGRHPTHALIQGCHTGRLSARFGRKVRNIVGSAPFAEVFPGVGLSNDNQDKADWSTNQGGEYYAVGMDGALPGRRANGVLIDDPFKGRKAADSETKRDAVWDTYIADIRSRLKIGEDPWIIIVNTRWHVDDLCGRILPEWDSKSGFYKAPDGEEWYVLNLPMEAEEDDPIGREIGEILWPEWFGKRKEWVEREKRIQGVRNWNALYQGHPTTEEGAILKAGFWRAWPEKKPPVVDYIVQSIDGAFEEDEENDYSARTTWGVFDIFHQDNAKVLQAMLIGTDGKMKKRHEVQRWHAILLEAWRGKVPFSTFKRVAIDGFKEYNPDRLLIEKKASGHSLIQELRKGSLPVKAVIPDRSKQSRAHAAEIPFEQGCVWHMQRDWVKPVIKECAQFPNGEYDDWVDTVTQALIWMRRTYHLEFKDDIEDKPKAKERVLPIYG